MVDNLIINVNIDLILKSGLSIQDYLFLQLIKSGKKELMREYHEQFGLILDKKAVDKLISLGYLQMINKEGKYLFDNFKVSKDFINLTDIKVEDAIQDIKNTYPKKTPSGSRHLQGDSNKWGPKYLNIIQKDRTLHEKILKCIEAEKVHRKKNNNEEFWALLLTYVNNKRWELFIESIDNLEEESVFSRDI